MDGELSEHERERYADQIARIGVEAQLRLKGARALVVGARASGCAAAAQLASSGVGYVAVADGGAVERADLCGQSLLYSPDVGANRAEAAAAKLGLLNPEIRAESYPVDPDQANADAIVIGHDVVLDCGAAVPLQDACRAAGAVLIVASGRDSLSGLQAAADAMEALIAAIPDGAPA